MDKNKVISGFDKVYYDGYKDGRASVVLPHPCDGPLYKDCTAADYFAKIAEEHLEVIEAYKEIEKKDGDIRYFLAECTDLIIATTSLMNYLGCDEKMRQQYMKEINESNAKRDGGRRFANEELPASALAFPVYKDTEKSDPMKNEECLLPEYIDEYFRDKKIDGETVTLLRGEKYGKIAVRIGDELYYVSYEPLKKVDENTCLKK